MLKHKGKSKKNQGDVVETNSASSTNTERFPRSFGRGSGSAYAYALENVMEKSKKLKQGSQKGFLGVEKVSLNPSDHSHSLRKRKK